MNNILIIGNLALNLPGYQITTASTEESLNRLQTMAPPDLLVVSGICEGRSGTILVREIRKLERCKHIPILMLYTNWDSPDRIRAFEAGCNDTAAVSSHPKEIRLRIESLLKLRSWPTP
jgi:DNA-binding response OmpR family regulator